MKPQQRKFANVFSFCLLILQSALNHNSCFCYSFVLIVNNNSNRCRDYCVSTESRFRCRCCGAVVCGDAEKGKNERGDLECDNGDYAASFGIASVDLSKKWIEVVREGNVFSNAEVPATKPTTSRDDEKASQLVSIRYGVRFDGGRFYNFIEAANDDATGESSRSDWIADLQSQLGLSFETNNSSNGKGEEETLTFVAQLQLVRTLRPPPSPGFAGCTTSVPPEYDARTDSFVAGPLRLELRPLLATLKQQQQVSAKTNELPQLSTDWDVFHNVSPADTRGHFLLLPSLSDSRNNWRGQTCTKLDCYDLISLVVSIRPVGSLFVGFNSVGAGASQNHVHFHAWPNPPLPLQLLQRPYAVTEACTGAGSDSFDIFNGMVKVSLLDYPVFCIKLSSFECSQQQLQTEQTALHALGNVLGTVLESIGTAPYNIGFLNTYRTSGPGNAAKNGEEKSERVGVDVFVFVRSKERSSLIPSLKLGISEMMGLFHAQSEPQLQHLVAETPTGGDGDGERSVMERALKDVSVGNRDVTFRKIKKHIIATFAR